jgi:sec-independent protein translocase protein TatA
MLHLLALAWPGPFEMILLAGLGLLIFGKRLPEVGRNIGKGIVEFKKGLKEAENELTQEPPVSPPAPPPQISAPKYKFDPYTGKPIDDQTSREREDEKISH